MRKLLVGAVVATAMLLPHFDASAGVSGEDLVVACEHARKWLQGRDHDPFAAGVCIGYVSAHNEVAKGAEFFGAKAKHGSQYPNYCILHDFVSVEESIRVLHRWIADNPEKVSEFSKSASVIVGLALMEAFPCDRE